MNAAETRPAEQAQEKPRTDPLDSKVSEMALLGSMLFAPKVIGDVLEIVTGGEVFAYESHRIIFEAAVRLHLDEKPIDLVVLRDDLAKDGHLDRAGGSDYLMSLVDGVPNAANAPEYAKQVLQKHKLRLMRRMTADLISEIDRGNLPDGTLDRLVDLRDATKQRRVIEVVSAAGLGAEEDEKDRCSHFREKFYFPALGQSVGDPRSGKGTLWLWILLSLALGRPLGPGVECVAPASCVIFTAEDTRRRLRAKLRSMCLGIGLPIEAVDHLHFIVQPKPRVRLPEDLDILKRTLDPFEPKLLIVDNLSRIAIGRKMNLDEEMIPVGEALEELRDHFGAAVEVIHHTSKAPNPKDIYAGKGAGGIAGVVDHQIRFDRDDKRSTMTFANSRDDDDWSLSFIENRLEDGGVRYELAPDSLPKESPRTAETREKILNFLRKLPAQKIQKKEIAAAVAMSTKQVGHHLDTLLSMGLVEKLLGGLGIADHWSAKT